jgi:hypothetical protein
MGASDQYPFGRYSMITKEEILSFARTSELLPTAVNATKLALLAVCPLNRS